MTEKTQVARKKGAPSEYSQEIADKIVGLIEEGYSERKIGKMPGMPSARTIIRWKDDHPDFCQQSARARQIAADKANDEREEIADWFASESKKRAQSGVPFPKGVVEAVRAVMQEKARSAAIRDDSRFGDRKTVAVEAAGTGNGLKDFYDSLLKDLKDADA